MTLNPFDWFRWLRAWRRAWWVYFVTWWCERPLRQLQQIDEKSIAVAQSAIDKWHVDAEIRRSTSPEGLGCEGCRERHSAMVFTNPRSNRHAKEFLCAGCFLDSLLAETDHEIAALKRGVPE